jgi:L-amino acid N-acyltransferase YncA
VSSDLIIRPFQWKDVPDITRIYGHYVDHSTATFDTEKPGETFIAEKFGHMVEMGHPVIVAERDGKMLGYAYASTFRPRYAYRFTCEDTLYLDPEMVSQGVGSALLEKLVEECQKFGFKQMVAVITAGNPASIKLHEKFGFVTMGTYPELGYKFDKWLDIVHMQLRL